MATRRRSAKGKAAGRRPVEKRAGTSGGPAAKRKTQSGARRERRSGLAREVRAGARAESAQASERAGLRLAEAQGAEPVTGDPIGALLTSAAAAGAGEAISDAGATPDRDAAAVARRIEEEVRAGSDDLRRRAEAASVELGRRRTEREASAREERPGLPGVRDIVLELAVGAARIARALLTLPIRIGLAALRGREA